MKSLGKYSFEFILLWLVAFLAITGFWNIYFGQGSEPNAYHHLHVIANIGAFVFILISLAVTGIIPSKKVPGVLNVE